MITGIGHVAYNVKDLDAAQHFYCDILGFREVFRFDRDDRPYIVYLQVNANSFIELFPTPDFQTQPEPEGSKRHLCLQVDDIKATLQELADRGLEISGEAKVGMDHNPQYWIADPDGNRIELMQIVPESPHAEAGRNWSQHR